MNAISYERREQDWDRYAGEPPDDDRMPGRPRRQYFNRWSAALVALITCAIGFYAGVRVEKGQVSPSSSAASSAAAGFAARARALAGGSTAAGSGGGAAGAARTGASGAGASAAGASGAGASGTRSGSGASFGTVSSVKDGSLYVTTASGNTVKVKLSSSTKVSKNLSVGRKSIRPGDTVVIQGLTNSSGTLVAAVVSDSGAAGSGGGGLAGLFGARGGFGSAGGSSSGGASGSGGGSSSKSGGGSGPNSAVGSLFSSGGGG